MNKSERDKRSTKAFIIGSKTEEGRLKVNKIECCKSVAGDAKINAAFFALIALLEGIITKLNLNLYYNDIIKIIVSVLLGSLGSINAARAVKFVIDAVKNNKEAYNLEEELLTEANIK